MKASTIVIAGFLAFSTQAAHAACAPHQNEILSCMAGSKQLNLCLDEWQGQVSYSYGPVGAPELELERVFHAIRYHPWNGIGRAIWESVELDNQGFTYVVFAGYDKIDDLPYAGVNVFQGQEFIVEVNCDSGGGAFIFDELAEAMRQNGICLGPNNTYVAGACE